VINLLDLDAAGLVALFADLGEKPYRAKQVSHWVHQRLSDNVASMTDLARPLRERLADLVEIRGPTVVSDTTAGDGTRKWLLDVGAGNAVEMVYIPEDDRGTLCVSSQAGCALDCAFCSTGKQGFNRNLSTAEIVGQVWLANRELGTTGLPDQRAVTNVVLMGMGEPLANYDAVRLAVDVLTAEWGHSISPRRITVSTVGLAPLIPRFIAETRVNLAVSLHGTTDEQRARLVPVNRRYPLAALMAACREVPLARRKRITFEYVMLSGENDSDADARRLVQLLHGLRAKVNLIPFNPFPSTAHAPSPRARIVRFQEVLLSHGVHATIRESRGQDIQAACGQLAVARPAA